MSSLVFNKATKKLTWGAEHYNAITGGFDLGPLPDGSYEVKTRHVVTGSHLASGFENSLTGNKWFIPIIPNFAETRDGFGIHPDGNVPGTKGCIGLQASDAGSFWRRWMNAALNARPTQVTVKS